MLARMRSWRRGERGISTAAIFIVGLPLIVGAFGYGVDSLRLQYTKEIVRSRLDLAAQMAAATTYTDATGQVILGAPGAGNELYWKTVGYQIYRNNTARLRGTPGSPAMLQCDGGIVAPVGTTTLVAVNPNDPSVLCAGQMNQIGSPQSNWCLAPGTYTGPLGESTRPVYGVRYAVTETMPTVFLRLLGVQQLTFSVSSEALLRQNC